jgi:glycolate oxidase FAD binding subunit
VRDDTAPNAPELLFVRLRGAVAAVESACTKMLADVPGQRMDNAQTVADWTACRDQKLPFFSAPEHIPAQAPEPRVLWRLSVPPTTPALNLQWPQLVEWHGGQRWLWAPESASQQLRQDTASVGGSASIFIAASAINTKARGIFSPLKPAVAQIHQRLKAEFDPAGIFNPGRMYPEF